MGIIDLQPTAGRCPLCGHDRFSYFILKAGGAPTIRVWRRHATEGTELLARQSQNKHLH